jgi:hypothetical protein
MATKEETMSYNPDDMDQPRTDAGVPIGDADVEADRLNASNDDDDAMATDDGTWAQQGAAEGRTDAGVPVGDADVEADRRNAGE